MRIRPFYLWCTYFRCSGRRLLRPLYTRPQEFCILKHLYLVDLFGPWLLRYRSVSLTYCEVFK